MNLTVTILIRTAVVSCILLGVSLSIYRKERKTDSLRGDNKDHPVRFILFFIGALLLSAGSAFLPELIFPTAGVCLILAVLSNLQTGIAMAVVLNALPLLLNEKSFEYYLFGVLTALLLLVLILRDNTEHKVVEPLIIYALVYITLYTALIVLKRQSIVPALIINPAVGLLLNLILSAVCGVMVRQNIAQKKDNVESIVDPEFFLLLRLKGENRDEYKRAIHTAYLCDRMADRLGKNRLLLKGGGFYHRIGVLEPESGDLAQDCRFLMEDSAFPEELVELVAEYHDESREDISAEASILFLSDRVITEILKRFSEGEEDINYNRMIDTIIGDLVSKPGGRLQKSGLTVHDLYRIRKYLKEEKLYYDFLR